MTTLTNFTHTWAKSLKRTSNPTCAKLSSVPAVLEAIDRAVWVSEHWWTWVMQEATTEICGSLSTIADRNMKRLKKKKRKETKKIARKPSSSSGRRQVFVLELCRVDVFWIMKQLKESPKFMWPISKFKVPWLGIPGHATISRLKALPKWQLLWLVGKCMPVKMLMECEQTLCN